MTAPARRKPAATLSAPAVVDAAFAVTFAVPGRPVPWKVPVVFRNGGSKKDDRLVAWQQTVGLYARRAMGPCLPYDGAVEIHLIATVAPPRDRRYRDPDCTNVIKAIEDALQGIVIVNDRQVCRQFVERVRGDDERVVIGVRAVGGELR